jgi:rubrerythrin
MLNGFKMFYADVIDSKTKEQALWYIIEKDYDAALKMFIEEANDTWDRYEYYFYEIEDKDIVQSFAEYYENVVAGIYEM